MKTVSTVVNDKCSETERDPNLPTHPELRNMSPKRSGWSPRLVALAVLLFYGGWFGAFVAGGHDVRRFIAMDDQLVFHGYVVQHPAGSAIRFDPHFPYQRHAFNYDGQWFYLMALDPVNARYYVQFPQYRYTKILYPMTASVLGLGRADLIPYSLILTNIFALVIGAFFLAKWLARRNLSPAYALLYAGYFGLFLSFQHDLTEPLSYAFVILGIYLYDFGGRYHYAYSGGAFAAAILTRDKAVIFAVVYGAAALFTEIRIRRRDTWFASLRRTIPRGVALLSLALVPALAYRVFLHYWLGSVHMPGNEIQAPLSGMLSGSVSTGALVVESISVFAPTLVCLALGAWALARGVWKLEILLLFVNSVLGLVTLDVAFFQDFRGVTRVATAIVLCTLLCIPWFDQLTPRRRLWLVPCGVCWTILTIVWAEESLRQSTFT